MNDTEVWCRFKEGSESDFAFLYRKFAPVLFRYGCKLSGDRDLVKDCLQLLFLHLWNNRLSLGNPVSVKNYLLKSIRHQIIKALGKSGRHADLPENYHYEAVASYETELIDHQASELTHKTISSILAKLSDRQREVIFLKYYSNLSYLEIASVMGIEEESVYKLTYKAIQKLQIHLHALFQSILLFVVLK